jgi:hypothetical protein
MTSATYIVNTELAAERFTNEAVFINIEKGLYYSVQGAALDIYDCFETPLKADDALSFLAIELEGADKALLAQAFHALVEHELIIESELPSQSVGRDGTAHRVFIVPAISVFDDLAELIALDPVHEVDAESGWPVRPPSFPDVV